MTSESCKQWRKKNPNYTKQWNDKFNPQRLKYKGKQIRINVNPRTGVCSWCGRQDMQTQMHHFAEYHDDDPLKDTIELCASCHKKEFWRLKQENDSK